MSYSSAGREYRSSNPPDLEVSTRDTALPCRWANYPLFPFYLAMIGQRGWIRTTDLLRPRQAGTAKLPYTLVMTRAHGRTRTCTSLVRNQALYPVELRVR